jgi:hypothetical protein
MPHTATILPEELVLPSERRRSFWVAVAVGGTIFVLVAWFIIQGLILSNTDTTVNDVRNSQTYHNQTLNRIAVISESNHAIALKVDHLAEQMNTYIKNLGGATMTVDQILQEAGQVSAKLQADEQAICQKLGVACPG